MLSGIETTTTGSPVMNAVLGVSVLGPAAIAALAALAGRRNARLVGRLGAVGSGLAFLGAAALAVASARGDAVSVTAHGADGQAILAVSADRLAVVLLMLVFGVSTIVQAFAVRYLAEDARAGWFTAGAGLLTTGSALLMTAQTLWVLAIGWTVAGVALCLLLATYWPLPAARDGVRRTATAFLIGDLALWVAVGIVATHAGTVDLGALRAQPLAGTTVVIAACLVVAAALSRSAQIPFHRWLPATLAAPTPVSAMLHAGVVNAGGILLIKLSPLMAASGLAQALTILAGIATLAYGAVVMLVKPDIKGALAHSTMAQMGFMILTCGLGLWAAAVFHLVAHGFYKATLFLSSGSAIAYRRRKVMLPAATPTASQRRVALVAAPVLPAAALGLAVAVVPSGPGDHLAEWALLIFAWVTGTAATWGWLARRPGSGGVFGAAAFLLPAATAYVGLVATVGGFLAPALPTAILPAAATWLITGAALTVLVGLGAVRWAPGGNRLQRTLYTRALSAGHIAPPSPTRPATALTGARS
ncbi:proton-conducting transporter transmembrane domain-containing protein [Mycolicibacterium anyangense]|uniref:proton-conducting transporter transmembrane domain-containing protein n=1 Tax=Mycolicibacterium anyangense TaxID=1431246 RepID=UPI0013CFE18A|nr:proton-conducting transporter membrane subunit [Mycolicibacterium anyangense]